jgi:hypothetical protein
MSGNTEKTMELYENPCYSLRAILRILDSETSTKKGGALLWL